MGKNGHGPPVEVVDIQRVPTWDDVVDEGLKARRQKDGSQWKLGDLALTVEKAKTYGEHALEQYAQDIGENYNTLRQYRQVAEAYGSDARASDLPWRHHLVVASRPDRLKWLSKASGKGWSVSQMQDAIRKVGILEGMSLEELRLVIEQAEARIKDWEQKEPVEGEPVPV